MDFYSYPPKEQNFLKAINGFIDLNKFFINDNTNKIPLAFNEKEIKEIFDQAMINSGINKPQLNN